MVEEPWRRSRKVAGGLGSLSYDLIRREKMSSKCWEELTGLPASSTSELNFEVGRRSPNRRPGPSSSGTTDSGKGLTSYTLVQK